jgi:Fibronectin type III domain
MLTNSIRRTGLAILIATGASLAACNGDDDPVQPPAPPTNAAVATPATTSLTLNWATVSGATGYVIRRSAGATGGTPSIVPNTLAGTASTFIDTGLEPNTTYRYQIATVRGTDTSAFSAEVTGATLQSGSAGTVDVSADIVTSTTWSADRTYRLTRIISVANGAVLTIQPGTRVIGAAVTDGSNPTVTALVVLKGSKLIADGTRSNPIVMTSAAAAGSAAPGDWGGVVLVGNATSNRTGRTVVEGPTPVDTVSWNGGTADGDNSGSLNYVRIEFAGAAGALNVELNCLSMYAVGRGTSIQNVQCLRGLDDSFEWFGGTVDGRNLISYESGDDHFDAAEGYRGRNQFLIAIQTGPRVSPRPGNVGALSAEQSGFEVDGCGSTAGTCATGFNSTPFTEPVFANFTVIGPGPGVLPVRAGRDGGLGANIRRGAGGSWINGIIARWPESAISVFQQETADRLTADSLDIRNMLLVDNVRSSDEVGADAATDPNARRFFQQTRWTGRSIDSASTATDAVFTSFPAASVAIANGATFDFTPVAASPARTGGLSTLTPRIAARVAGFFGGALAGTAYRGAADPAVALASQWWTGWTSYRRN